MATPTDTLTADEFFQRIEDGEFPPERRVELWDGVLSDKPPKTLEHKVCTANLFAAMIPALPPGWCIWLEDPIRLDTSHAPLADLRVPRGKPYDYLTLGRHPAPEDVGLVIEITQTSDRNDFGAKLEAYARALVPVYWAVNLLAHRIEVHSQPEVRDGRGVYQSSRIYGPEDTVPLVLDGREVAQIPARDILLPL